MHEKILIVEDEERILQFLSRGLAYEGYRVLTAVNGTEGLQVARENTPDLVILDWMLPEIEPGLDGLEVCRRLRAASDLPIIMLTAKESVSDRVLGLDAGADDYLVKPFALNELLARIRALVRRAKTEAPENLNFVDLRLDTGTHQVFRGERVVELTAKEYELLELFLRNPQPFFRSTQPQHITDPVFEKQPVDRLGKKVGCTGFIGLYDGFIIIQAGDHQNRRMFGIRHLTDLCAGIKSVHFRHLDVQ